MIVIKFYIAYGSNLKISQMNFRCPQASIYKVTQLEDWKLVFKGNDEDKYYLTIEPSIGSYVPVVIWKISESDEKSLDKYEKFSRFYYKKDFKIKCDNEVIDAFAYIMTDENTYGLPEQEYIDRCTIGYNDFNLDIKIFNKALEDTKLKSI